MDVVGLRWTDRIILAIFPAESMTVVSRSLFTTLVETVSGTVYGTGGSYGFEQGLIEVMGTQLLGHDDVEGWLTARQVTKMWRCRNAAKNR